MTPSLRYARGSLAAATLFFTAALYTVALSGVPWLVIPGLYVAGFFAWLAGRCYTDHHRILAEHAEARRRAFNGPPRAESTTADHDPRSAA